MVDNYNNKKKEIEQSNTPNKEGELKQAKSELVKKVDESIEGSIGVSMPHLPINFSLSLKREKRTEEYRTNIEIPPKK